MPKNNFVSAYWHTLDDNRIQCDLCPRACIITNGNFGYCRARKVEDNKLIAWTYGRVSSMAMDPIEKKPLYHFYPGSKILSIGSIGCNLGCTFCQNWQISREARETEFISPEKLLEIAQKSGSIGVAFTYNEPFIWFEYVMDCAKILRANNQKVVLVTNGYVLPKPLDELLTFIDAMNIDLKGITNKFYEKLCSGALETVKETIKLSYSKTHIEITNLLITNENDSEEEITKLIDFVASLDTNIPLHFSRYFPNYKLEHPPTSEKILKEAYKLAKRKLNYVYLGNIYITEASNTYCYKCANELISRSGYDAQVLGLEGSKCNKCYSEQNIII